VLRSASGFCLPDAIAFDPAGNLWTSETGGNRVLRFDDDCAGDPPALRLARPQGVAVEVNAGDLADPHVHTSFWLMGSN
jgi:secreted PhoX family phosphatase